MIESTRPPAEPSHGRVFTNLIWPNEVFNTPSSLSIGAHHPWNPPWVTSSTLISEILGDLIIFPMHCMLDDSKGAIVKSEFPVRLSDTMASGKEEWSAAVTAPSTLALSLPKRHIASFQEHQISASWADRNPPMGTPFLPWLRIKLPKAKRVSSWISNNTYLKTWSSDIFKKSFDAPLPSRSNFFMPRLCKQNHCSFFPFLTRRIAHFRAFATSCFGISQNISSISISMGSGGYVLGELPPPNRWNALIWSLTPLRFWNPRHSPLPPISKMISCKQRPTYFAHGFRGCPAKDTTSLHFRMGSGPSTTDLNFRISNTVCARTPFGIFFPSGFWSHALLRGGQEVNQSLTIPFPVATVTVLRMIVCCASMGEEHQPHSPNLSPPSISLSSLSSLSLEQMA